MLEVLYKFTEDDVLFLPPVPDKQQAFELESFICNYKFFLRRKTSNTSSPPQDSSSYFLSFADDVMETHLQRKS